MDMRTFLQSINADERKKVAKSAGTSVNYLYQIAGGHRDPSKKLAIKLSHATGGAVSVAELLELQEHLKPSAGLALAN